jgi:hypothetical protein
MYKFVPILNEKDIYSIEAIGRIYDKMEDPGKYDRSYAGNLSAPFYMKLKDGRRGREGQAFYDTIRYFLENRVGNAGGFFWLTLWRLIMACSYLHHNYNSSFSEYMLAHYKRYSGKSNISEEQFLLLSEEEWGNFLNSVKPWKKLMGIGPNAFDFIFGDIIEARFANQSYKLDKANIHFFKVSGISELIGELNRENIIEFLNTLNLKYTLRQINKGIYTYCSITEKDNYGFCRSPSQCIHCNVNNICLKLFKNLPE